MKTLLPTLLLIFSGQAVAECVADRGAILQMDENEFDQNPKGGWRKVSRIPGCTLAAADLIKEYREANNPGDTTLYFHEAQLRAKAEQVDAALALFNKSKYEPSEDKYGWNYYVRATIAFLSNDKEELLRAKELLGAVAKPANIQTQDTNGNPIEIPWPPNMHIVESFIQCFGADYEYAYNGCK